MQTTPIDFQPPADAAPAILLPVTGSIFAVRAERFAALAPGHSLADWLAFLGHLARAQHDALQALPPLQLPAAARLEEARRHGMPPLNATALVPPSPWIGVVRQIAVALEPLAPEPARKALAALRTIPPEWLDRLAATLLAGDPDADDSAELPFIGAALQVVWTALAGQLDAAQLRPLDTAGVCPCCGSLPVASIVRTASTVNNLRYLHCSLCSTEWNVPRAKCTTCDGDKAVAYQQIDGSNGAARAETCDECRSYLKIFHQEKDARVDPVADDLASLALDLLVDEAGYQRSGPNLLLIGGGGD